MKTIPDILASMIEAHRKPGETIPAAADRILFSYRPYDVDCAVAEAERRARWKAGR